MLQVIDNPKYDVNRVTNRHITNVVEVTKTLYSDGLMHVDARMFEMDLDNPLEWQLFNIRYKITRERYQQQQQTNGVRLFECDDKTTERIIIMSDDVNNVITACYAVVKCMSDQQAQLEEELL